MNQFLRAAFADALDNPTRDDTLNHFSHCHLLQHCHLSGIKFNFCNVTIYAQSYACLRCDYYIHDVCSNFPREIHHDFHPGYDHTLVLKHFQLANDDEQFHCAACGIDDSELSLFQSYYCCDSCNFNLHVECASIPTTLNLKVKYPLHLFFSLPMNGETASLSCSICTKVVPTSGCWVFYNHDHVYLCHFDCAAVIEFSMETDSLGQLQNRLQTLAITSRPPARANQPSGGVTHFTHRHSLKEYGSAKSLRCSLCNFAFMKGYICVGCNYFIDNICFSLPSMIQHMSHPQRPLKLTWYSDFQNGNQKCLACQYYTDHTSGWAYCCTKCDFLLIVFVLALPRP